MLWLYESEYNQYFTDINSITLTGVNNRNLHDNTPREWQGANTDTWERQSPGMITAIALLFAFCRFCGADIVSELALPPEHVPFYVHSHPGFSEKCRQNRSCELRVSRRELDG